MKKQIKLIALVVVIAGFTTPQITNAQGWGGRSQKIGLWDMWSINVNGGLTSFFGDLSRFDTEITEKLTKESGPAFSGILTKHINNKFGISGQLLYGNLQGENMSKISFEATFVEYNLQGRIDFINLFSPDNILNFGIVGYGGIGQFVFSSTKYDRREEQPEISVENTGTPEFVYFGGLGAYYTIKDRYSITVDMAMRQAQNDKLDDLNKNDNFDYYTFVSIGLTYHIHSLKKSSYGKGRGRNTRGRAPGRLPMRRRR